MRAAPRPLEPVVRGEPQRPVRRDLRGVVKIDAQPRRPPPRSAGGVLEVGDDQGIVEVGVEEVERLTAARRRLSALQLFERAIEAVDARHHGQLGDVQHATPLVPRNGGAARSLANAVTRAPKSARIVSPNVVQLAGPPASAVRTAASQEGA